MFSEFPGNNERILMNRKSHKGEKYINECEIWFSLAGFCGTVLECHSILLIFTILFVSVTLQMSL